MNDQDMDRLLERSLGGEPPGPIFRGRVVRDSTAAFVRARQRRARWRLMALTTAAVFIAAVSFLLGRGSVSGGVPQPAAGPVAAGTAETVVVPSELVAWVNAARLFRQLGMEDRVGRALDRAGRLMPPDTGGPGPAFAGAGQEEYPDETGRPDRPESFSVMKRIMAQSLGD